MKIINLKFFVLPIWRLDGESIMSFVRLNQNPIIKKQDQMTFKNLRVSLLNICNYKFEKFKNNNLTNQLKVSLLPFLKRISEFLKLKFTY